MRATLKDVAQRAGVSSATVSYVLNGKQSVSEKTKQRVLEAVRQLDYVPDLNARGGAEHAGLQADQRGRAADRTRRAPDVSEHFLQ